MNYKISRIVIGGIVLLSLFSCSPKVYDCLRYQTKSVIVDGQSNEWSNPLRYYDAASKLSYELTNDAENLYVVFSAKERSTIRKVMRKGLRFSIDTALGKGKYPMQFTFPYRNPNDFNPYFEEGFAHNDSTGHRHLGDSTHRRNPNDTSRHHRRMSADGKPWQPMLKVFVKGINTKLDSDKIGRAHV